MMKKYLSLILIAIQLGAPVKALAALSELDRSYLVGRNVLTNPGFEASTAGWTSSGGSLTTMTTATNVDIGGASGQWDSSAAAQTWTSGYVSINVGSGLSGANGVVSCRFKCDSGTCTHTLTANDGTNDLANASAITSTTTGYTRNSVNFIFPASGTVRVKIASVASNEPILYADSCYLGLAEGFNISQVNQAQILGTISYDSCSGTNWSNTSTSFAIPTALTGCTVVTTGLAQAPASQTPAIKFASMPPGEYVVQYEGGVQNTTASKNAYFRFTDGTINAREISQVFSAGGNIVGPGVHQSFTYTTAQSNVTLSLSSKTDSGGTAIIHGDPGVIKVYYFPSQSQTAFNPSQTPASWSGYSTVSGGCSTTSTTYADPSACTSIALTEITNRNLGTVATAASSLPGVTFTPPKTGLYGVCASGTVSTVLAANVSVRMTDGTTVLHNGATTSIITAGDGPFSICGDWNAASTSAATIKLQLAASTSTASIVNGAASGSSAIHWVIWNKDSGTSAPYLVGSITSNTSGAERVERALITNSGSCAVSRQSGTWLSSVSHPATGNCLLNFGSGIFPTTENCIVTPIGGSGENCSLVAETPGTSVQVKCYISTTATDIGFHVICMGPR